MRCALCVCVGVLALVGGRAAADAAADWVLGRAVVTGATMACLTRAARGAGCVVYYQCRLSARFFVDDAVCVMDIRSNACSQHQEISCTGDEVNNINSFVDQAVAEAIQSAATNGKCGVYNTERVESVDKEFPWLIAVVLKSKSETSQIWYRGEYLASGILIHPSVVLTGALSVYSSNVLLKADQIKCRAGDKIIEDSGSVSYQTRNVSKYALHQERYASGTYSIIALLFLEEPFPVDSRDGLMMGCLSNVQSVPDHGCFTISKKMAYTGRRQMTAVALKKVGIRFVDREVCKSQISDQLGTKYDIHASITCAIGDVGVNNYCKGIIGAPILCPTTVGASDIRLSLAGMVTFTISYTFPYEAHMYANMSYLRSWIDDTMQQEGFGTGSYEI